MDRPKQVKNSTLSEYLHLPFFNQKNKNKINQTLQTLDRHGLYPPMLRAVAAVGAGGRKGRRESGRAGEGSAAAKSPRAAVHLAAGREQACTVFFN